MKLFARTLGAALATLILSAGMAAAAAWTYVGSWEVDDGPNWTASPANYSGVDAAAMLFGGSASDYAISTVDHMVANIDHLAWVSTYGVYGGQKKAENAASFGLYDSYGEFSAYVDDNAIGSAFTNYAFRAADVPLPAAAPLLVAALAGVGLAGRRRKA